MKLHIGILVRKDPFAYVERSTPESHALLDGGIPTEAQKRVILRSPTCVLLLVFWETLKESSGFQAQDLVEYSQDSGFIILARANDTIRLPHLQKKGLVEKPIIIIREQEVQ